MEGGCSNIAIVVVQMHIIFSFCHCSAYVSVAKIMIVIYGSIVVRNKYQITQHGLL